MVLYSVYLLFYSARSLHAHDNLKCRYVMSVCIYYYIIIILLYNKKYVFCLFYSFLYNSICMYKCNTFYELNDQTYCATSDFQFNFFFFINYIFTCTICVRTVYIPHWIQYCVLCIVNIFFWLAVRGGSLGGFVLLLM